MVGSGKTLVVHECTKNWVWCDCVVWPFCFDRSLCFILIGNLLSFHLKSSPCMGFCLITDTVVGTACPRPLAIGRIWGPATEASIGWKNKPTNDCENMCQSGKTEKTQVTDQGHLTSIVCKITTLRATVVSRKFNFGFCSLLMSFPKPMRLFPQIKGFQKKNQWKRTTVPMIRISVRWIVFGTFFPFFFYAPECKWM